MQSGGSSRSAARRAGRRRLAALIATLVGGVAFIAGLAAGGSSSSEQDPDSAGPALVELPRGGRELLPDYRLVAYYGAPGSEELGALGIGTARQAGGRLLDQALPYASSDRPAMPVFELLASVAAASPGDDGLYRIETPDSTIRRYLAEARRREALLLLDVQPGRAEFFAEVDRLAPYLSEPDVGLALDPEWHVGPDEVPGQVIGSVEAETVNQISAELAALVEREQLPEKLFVIHQFTAGMIANRSDLVARPGLATVINVDGFGDQPSKIAKYHDLHPAAGSGLASGLKLFYNEDLDLMSPEQVLELRPAPDLIVYE